jgi:acyl-homoserine lactone acylase PvdQ
MIYLLVTFFVASLWSQTEFPCKTTYDELNIPHVTTQSTEEFYYCFGLHHGTDRAWELDYFRRAAQGRNAEVLGFSQLKSDLMMRLLDLP